MVLQLTKVGETPVDLSGGDQLVPMVLVQSGDRLSGQLMFRGSIYYPSRIGGNGGLEFPEKSVQEVLRLRCLPLVLVEGDDSVVAVYYTPGPEAVPMSSVKLVAT